MGLWLAAFLAFHLLTNSQAALFFGNDGEGFIEEVNKIHSLPYLPLIEAFLLGLPFLVHMAWGVQYLRTASPNSFGSDGSSPALPEYPRNRAYTWQRITSWILLFAVVLHVGQMRFLNYPVSVRKDGQKLFLTRLKADRGLPTVAERLHVKLYDQAQIEKDQQLLSSFGPIANPVTPDDLLQTQHWRELHRWTDALQKLPLAPGQTIAATRDFGTVSLLVVRETFKSPLMVALYSLFVLAACFHAFNGLWTFLIKWGVTLTPRSQLLSHRVATVIMVLVAALGLAAAWGTYWINLYE